MANETLLSLLTRQWPDSSRRTLRQWIAQGRVFSYGKRLTSSHLSLPSDTPLTIKKISPPAPHGLKIVYEDRYLIVVDKPSGLLTVATPSRGSLNVHHILKRRKGSAVYPVHRLDRGASGILVFAYHKDTKDKLKDLFSRHEITREYVALAEGYLHQKKGTWRCPLMEGADLSVRPHPEGAIAITHYSIIKEKFPYTLLAISLETGKKHQIRVHAAEAGIPLAGDKRYGALTDPLGRLALHARRLRFLHPQTHKEIDCHSPSPLHSKDWL
ncbi:MAG: RluA family pseudouridine synthase [Chlamydiota bacterium]|nr:RluA family pseudouridine synthase [Chlamydiota bacterium]